MEPCSRRPRYARLGIEDSGSGGDAEPTEIEAGDAAEVVVSAFHEVALGDRHARGSVRVEPDARLADAKRFRLGPPVAWAGMKRHVGLNAPGLLDAPPSARLVDILAGESARELCDSVRRLGNAR